MKIGHLYILDDDNNAVPVEDVLQWAPLWEEMSRSGRFVVAKTALRDGGELSTVFLGVDHGWHSASPILFETMRFPECEYLGRYATWQEAYQGHQEALARLHGRVN